MRPSSFLRRLVVPAILATAALAMPGVSDAKFVFEYNHPDLDWYTIETEHFYVHYPVSKHPDATHHVDATFMAQRTSKVAEEMWRPMCEQFDYYLDEKIHIVLLDQSDDLEGFTIPPWNWIEISGNPGGYFYRMRGRMEWFSDVLVHEFAHVVSLKRASALGEGVGGVSIGGLYRNGQIDSEDGGEVTFGGDTTPFWWVEGGAEYWSDNAGYNWWTSARDANLRMTVLQDRLLTYDEWVNVSDKRDWGDGERGYQQGYSFGLYLRERFGNEAYPEFSKLSSERWRANWETIVQDVTGVPLHTLYDDWKEYLRQKYTKQAEQVYADGLVEGGELELSRGEWEYHDPDGKDAWEANADTKNRHWKKRKNEWDREQTGTWDFYPKYSDDGKWVGEHTAAGGFSFAQYPEQLFPAIAGQDPGAQAADYQLQLADTASSAPNYGSNFGHGFDFIPGREAVVISGNEDMQLRVRGALEVETDGYDWGQLYVYDLSPNPKLDKRKHHGGKEEFQTWETKSPGGLRNDSWRAKAIPNTLRAADPAVSPDGNWVAYFEYSSGTVNLVKIKLDGSEKTPLTHWTDGTWMQNADWSPDGSQLVFSMIRNFRQDLYVINADGTGMKALNQDTWEDQDPFWAKDGNLYFSSEPTGIFNIFRYEPGTGKVTQLTNVIGGAECPWITPQGNLMYTAFTGFGWKNYILSKDEFLEKDVTDRFDFTPDDKAIQADLAYSEDLAAILPAPTKYPKTTGAWMSPTAVPLFRFENDSLTNFGLSAGGQIYAQDYVEDHVLLANVMIGEDPLFLGLYTYQGWYPNITFLGYHYEAKFDYGFLLDKDQNPDTTDDQSVEDGKQNQYVNIGRVDVQYPINGALSVTLGGGGFEYGFRGTSDTRFEPYMRGVNGDLRFNYSNIAGAYNSPNPRSGRAIDLNLEHAFTDVVYRGYNGYDTDDGQVLDKYAYNRVELRWTEHIPVPIKALQKNAHRIMLDGDFGYIDRNVSVQDEFRGGGTHPYFVGSGSLQPNNQFSGYPGFSLSGETMLILDAGYRFPVMREINKKIGPLYMWDLTAQFGGTAGNFWSYAPPDAKDTDAYYFDQFGQRVAYDPDSIHREIPFVDKAYKNDNYLLYDANAELRLSSTLFGQSSWNSFVRLSYGFNRIKGVGDVNGDDIQDTTDNGLGDAVSNETEAPGPRLYIGLGTGW
jgi:hypothetical protein